MKKNLKNIKLFEDYFAVNEAEGDPNNNEEETIDVKTPERNSAVVTKKFFNELEHNLYYWFKHGKIKDKYDLVDIDQENRGVTIWLHDKVEDETEEPKYMYRVKYYEADPKGMVEKMEDVMVTIDVYNHDKTEKMKDMTLHINVKNVNEDFLLDRLERIVKKIVKDPNNKEDHDKFMGRQYTRLTDEYY